MAEQSNTLQATYTQQKHDDAYAHIGVKNMTQKSQQMNVLSTILDLVGDICANLVPIESAAQIDFSLANESKKGKAAKKRPTQMDALIKYFVHCSKRK